MPDAITAPPQNPTLPVLSLARAHSGCVEHEAFLAELRAAARNVGFFYLSDHGVDLDLGLRLFAEARRFFDLPETEKLDIEMIRSPHFRGYTRIAGERTRGQIDWREQIDLGPETPAMALTPDSPPWRRLHGPNQWPQALPDLRALALRWQTEMSKLSTALLAEMSMALGAPRDFFAPLHHPTIEHLTKIIRYPGADVAGGDQGVGAHKDAGILTFVLQHETAGLQVEGPDGWISAPPRPGTFVVNIGEILEMASDGYLKATTHRVVGPPAGQDRLSIAFFLGANYECDVPLLSLPPELAAASRGIDRDPQNPLFNQVGRNRLKSRLRSHPDVAQRHHANLLTGEYS